MTYEDMTSRVVKKSYSRIDRFHRALTALSGLQNVSYEIMEKCAALNANNPEELRLLMNKTKMKKSLPRIASIWRQLGNNYRGLSILERQKAANIFKSINEKKSFLVLIPWIVIQIGRQDLMCFLKKASRKMQNKYELIINEAYWESSPGMGERSNSNEIRTSEERYVYEERQSQVEEKECHLEKELCS